MRFLDETLKAHKGLLLSIVWLFPMLTKLRKFAAGDTISSLTRSIKLGSKLKFFASVFGKVEGINIYNREKENPSKIVRFFVSHTYEAIKLPWVAATKHILKPKHFNLKLKEPEIGLIWLVLKTRYWNQFE